VMSQTHPKMFGSFRAATARASHALNRVYESRLLTNLMHLDTTYLVLMPPSWKQRLRSGKIRLGDRIGSFDFECLNAVDMSVATLLLNARPATVDDSRVEFRPRNGTRKH
jgi:hypothetical protein